MKDTEIISRLVKHSQDDLEEADPHASTFYYAMDNARMGLEGALSQLEDGEVKEYFMDAINGSRKAEEFILHPYRLEMPPKAILEKQYGPDYVASFRSKVIEPLQQNLRIFQSYVTEVDTLVKKLESGR